MISDAQCVSLPDDKSNGLSVIRQDQTSVLVPFRENVTLNCGTTGRVLRRTATSGFRQCVYDPKQVISHEFQIDVKLIRNLMNN